VVVKVATAKKKDKRSIRGELIERRVFAVLFFHVLLISSLEGSRQKDVEDERGLLLVVDERKR